MLLLYRHVHPRNPSTHTRTPLSLTDGPLCACCSWELVRGIGSLTPEIKMDEAALERERLKKEAEAAAAARLAAEAAAREDQ